MTKFFDRMLHKLADREVVIPYLENAIKADNWPTKYTVEIDSSPYYGLFPVEGRPKPDGPGDGYFHPSTHPLMSERELYYQFHPDHQGAFPEKEWGLGAMMSLNVGTAIHGILQTQLKMAGLLDPADEEWEYVNDDHFVRGRIDGAVLVGGSGKSVLEIKTSNERSFRSTNTATPGWEAQTNLGMDNYGADEAIILVVQTSYPWPMKEIRVRRNQELIDGFYAKFDRVREAIWNNTPPACEHAIDTKCALSHICWPEEAR